MRIIYNNIRPFKILIFFFFINTCATICSAQDTEGLDAIMRRHSREDEFLGSVAVYKEEGPVYQWYGFIDPKHRTKANDSTLFKIGSVTKTFTATAILSLLDEGKLSLDSKLEKYLPGEIPFGSEVTIEDLLRHESGITDEAWFQWKYKDKAFRKKKGRHYSNANYGLLGMVAEKIEGKDLGEIFTERIFEPCQLEFTNYGIDSSKLHHLAPAFRKANKSWVEIPPGNLMDAAGAGAIVSTADDLYRFMSWLFSGDLISEQSLNQMTTLRDGYGLGLMQANYYQHRGFTHSGEIGGYKSVVVHFPEARVTVVVLSNGLNISLNSILKDLLDTGNFFE